MCNSTERQLDRSSSNYTKTKNVIAANNDNNANARDSPFLSRLPSK